MAVNISHCNDGLFHNRVRDCHKIWIYKCSKCGKTLDMQYYYTEHGTKVHWYDLAHKIMEWP